MTGGTLEAVVFWLTIAIAAYSVLINSSFLVLTGLALSDLAGYRRRLEYAGYDQWFLDPNTRSISVLMPAHNESATIVASVQAMISLRYPDFEVVVIDDGSTDDTRELLIREFDMAPVPLVASGSIPVSGEVEATYVSRRGAHNLALVVKANGGKADALNAGINHSRKELVCMVDADSLLDPQALLNVARPFADNPGRVVAAGGVVRVANGSRVDRGRVTSLRMPARWLSRIAVVEYLRAFLIGRSGWSRLGGLLIISGAFGIFRKDVLLEVGGMSVNSIGEDAELVVRIHRMLGDRDQDAEVVFVPEPVAWTEVPETREVLRKQRRRWHRGLAEIFLRHGSMMFRPRYGVIGMLTMPWFLVFELLAPLVEVVGLIWFVVLLLLMVAGRWWPGLDLVDPQVVLLLAGSLRAVRRVRDTGGDAGRGAVVPPVPRDARPREGDLGRRRGELRLPAAQLVLASRRPGGGVAPYPPRLGRDDPPRLRLRRLTRSPCLASRGRRSGNMSIVRMVGNGGTLCPRPVPVHAPHHSGGDPAPRERTP